jgi:hypothetical protein
LALGVVLGGREGGKEVEKKGQRMEGAKNKMTRRERKAKPDERPPTHIYIHPPTHIHLQRDTDRQPAKLHTNNHSPI